MSKERKCSICSKPAKREWVNPVNPQNRALYCEKHFKAIDESFNKFLELYFYRKNVEQDPLLAKESLYE